MRVPAAQVKASGKTLAAAAVTSSGERAEHQGKGETGLEKTGAKTVQGLTNLARDF